MLLELLFVQTVMLSTPVRHFLVLTELNVGNVKNSRAFVNAQVTIINLHNAQTTDLNFTLQNNGERVIYDVDVDTTANQNALEFQLFPNESYDMVFNLPTANYQRKIQLWNSDFDKFDDQLCGWHVIGPARFESCRCSIGLDENSVCYAKRILYEMNRKPKGFLRISKLKGICTNVTFLIFSAGVQIIQQNVEWASTGVNSLMLPVYEEDMQITLSGNGNVKIVGIEPSKDLRPAEYVTDGCTTEVSYTCADPVAQSGGYLSFLVIYFFAGHVPSLDFVWHICGKEFVNASPGFPKSCPHINDSRRLTLRKSLDKPFEVKMLLPELDEDIVIDIFTTTIDRGVIIGKYSYRNQSVLSYEDLSQRQRLLICTGPYCFLIFPVDTLHRESGSRGSYELVVTGPSQVIDRMAFCTYNESYHCELNIRFEEDEAVVLQLETSKRYTVMEVTLYGYKYPVIVDMGIRRPEPLFPLIVRQRVESFAEVTIQVFEHVGVPITHEI